MNGSVQTDSVSIFTKDGVKEFKMFCYSFIILVGCLGNFAIIVSFCVKKQLKDSEYFVLNLTVTDLCVCLISVPFDLIEIALGYWPFGAFLCKVIYPFQTVLMGVSVFTMLCMALERHRAIINPLRERKKKKYLLFVIFVTWASCVILVSPYIAVLREDGQECKEGWPGTDYFKAYTMCSFLIFYLFPLVIITAAYIHIGIRMWHNFQRFQIIIGTTRKSSLGRRIMDARSSRSLRIVKIFVCAVVSFALCLLPFHVMFLWADFGSGSSWPHFNDAKVFAYVLLYANSMIDPFIFGTLTRRCRLWVFCEKNSDDTFSQLFTSKTSAFLTSLRQSTAIRCLTRLPRNMESNGVQAAGNLEDGDRPQGHRRSTKDFYGKLLATRRDSPTSNNFNINQCRNRNVRETAL